MRITRRQLRKASLENLERLARFHNLEMPHMPRHWHGYKDSLVKKLERITDREAVMQRCSAWRV